MAEIIVPEFEPVRAVVWDVDRVWYPGISTSYCADAREGSPREYVLELMGRGYFTQHHLDMWQDATGRDPLETYSNAARFFTDILYNTLATVGSHTPVMEKRQVVEAKQGLLKGMTLQDIRRVVEDVIDQNRTPGLPEAIQVFDVCGNYTCAASDGLGPFIDYAVDRLQRN